MAKHALADRHRSSYELREALREQCGRAVVAGYDTAPFILMMHKYGTVGACKKVVMSRNVPGGFTWLLKNEHLDLSVEATILRGPWRVLFGVDVLDRARSRLEKHGRKDLAI